MDESSDLRVFQTPCDALTPGFRPVREQFEQEAGVFLAKPPPLETRVRADDRCAEQHLMPLREGELVSGHGKFTGE
jgi:hypothetical protein